MLPPFDFYSTGLSLPAKKQLAGIYGNRASGRTALLQLIVEHVHDPLRGTFLPISNVTRAKEFHESISLEYKCGRPFQPFPRLFFSNALIEYTAFEFDPPKPKFCATNAGFVVVTVEVETGDPAVFEETLRWTRTTNGHFRSAPFAAVDDCLSRYKDYRGFSHVFSGNKSLHFNFVFCTTHLENAPCDVGPNERVASNLGHSAVMHAAYESIWDEVSETFKKLLPVPARFDRSLRSLTHWRRAPWGFRTLDQDSLVLGVPARTEVPQMVVCEKIRSRAIAGSSEFLVPALFSAATPQVSRRPSGAFTISSGISNASVILHKMREMCADEWGAEFPKPVSVKTKNNEYIINFQNHADDRKPSTYVKGDYRGLELLGQNAPNGAFFLPDGLTADEFVKVASRKVVGISWRRNLQQHEATRLWFDVQNERRSEKASP